MKKNKRNTMNSSSKTLIALALTAAFTASSQANIDDLFADMPTGEPVSGQVMAEDGPTPVASTSGVSTFSELDQKRLEVQRLELDKQILDEKIAVQERLFELELLKPENRIESIREEVYQELVTEFALKEEQAKEELAILIADHEVALAGLNSEIESLKADLDKANADLTRALSAPININNPAGDGSLASALYYTMPNGDLVERLLSEEMLAVGRIFGYGENKKASMYFEGESQIITTGTILFGQPQYEVVEINKDTVVVRLYDQTFALYPIGDSKARLQSWENRLRDDTGPEEITFDPNRPIPFEFQQDAPVNGTGGADEAVNLLNDENEVEGEYYPGTTVPLKIVYTEEESAEIDRQLNGQ